MPRLILSTPVTVCKMYVYKSLGILIGSVWVPNPNGQVIFVVAYNSHTRKQVLIYTSPREAFIKKYSQTRIFQHFICIWQSRQPRPGGHCTFKLISDPAISKNLIWIINKISATWWKMSRYPTIVDENRALHWITWCRDLDFPFPTIVVHESPFPTVEQNTINKEGWNNKITRSIYQNWKKTPTLDSIATDLLQNTSRSWVQVVLSILPLWKLWHYWQ